MVTLTRDLIQQVITLPARHIWMDYDDTADVLYISFRKPQRANDSVMEDDAHIYHYADEELVGITILNASKVE